MSDEFFDVVNENDEPVGRATRREVHARGWRHRAVHILVDDGAGRIFLQKRSMRKDTSPGRWDSSSSGHVDAGELGEELGLHPAEAPTRMFRVEACAETGEEFVWVYRLRATGPFTLNTDEIESGGWFTPAEISSWIWVRPDEFAPSFRLIWKRAEAELR
jgi:isopentenyldiphosphate isomerase